MSDKKLLNTKLKVIVFVFLGHSNLLLSTIGLIAWHLFIT